MKTTFIVICLFFCFACLQPALTQNKKCPRRNRDLALQLNRKCRRSCIPNSNSRKHRCKNNFPCLCARECGFSCINLNHKCRALPNITHMTRLVTYRTIESSGGSNIITLAANETLFNFNDVAEYECEEGYTLYPPNAKHYCTGRRKWTTPGLSKCVKKCSEKDRNRVEQLGMECQQECLIDNDCSSGRQCLCDGACGRSCVDPNVDCGPAPLSSNATFNYSGSGLDKVAVYRCDPDYFFSGGTPTQICTGDGTWHGSLIECERVTCPDPSDTMFEMSGFVEGNTDTTEYFVGHQLIFRCDSYHKLRGARKRVCQENGQWSGTPTTCTPINQEKKNLCPHPGIPIGGRLIAQDDHLRRGFPIGASVQFECYGNLVLSPPNTLVCTKIRQWSALTPLCVDPRIRDSSNAILSKLQSSTHEIRGPNIGRTIYANRASKKEIYFLIDISKSITNDRLERTTRFAIKLIQRLHGRTVGNIAYSLIIFGLKSEILINILNENSFDDVVEELEDVVKNRTNLQKITSSGTRTSEALETLESQLENSYGSAKNANKEIKRHVFILTDGKHNDGPDPKFIVKRIIERKDQEPPTFYSISSCIECTRPTRDARRAYSELLNLANNKEENLIIIEDFYQVNEALDKVIDGAEIDYSECGQSGEIEGLLLQARVSIGRTINGVKAKEKTWPWQVLISWRANNIEDIFTFQFYDEEHVIGGGTLINNKWVLTAAHLFDGVAKFGNWQQNYLLSFGIHKRLTRPNEKLSSKVEIYRSQLVIEHDPFHLYDNDIALIKIGQQYQENHQGKFISTSISGYINFTEYIRPVCLPCTNSSCMTELLKESQWLIGNETVEERCRLEIRLLEQENEEHRTVVAATGFGHTKPRNVSDHLHELSEYLQQILLEIKPLNYCRNFSDNRIPWHLLDDIPDNISPLQRLQVPVTDRMMCGSTVGNSHDIVDTCQGDSGGPLVRQLYYEDDEKKKQESCWVQVGIVSWGWGCGQILENPREQIPGFYTDVTKFTSWISDKIARNAD